MLNRSLLTENLTISEKEKILARCLIFSELFIQELSWKIFHKLLEYEKWRKYLSYCTRLAWDNWFITDTKIYFMCQDSVKNLSSAFYEEALLRFCPGFYMNSNNNKPNNNEITILMKTMRKKWQNGFHWNLSLMLNILLSMHKSWLKVAVLAFFTLDFFYQER